ncbi:CvpA family protein [Sediminicola arcticus]|jgi:membrane protein required for colicin V production|uniref:CvpA family protein n=1 Tax=Sediminicola arcticus TaxID=1574308 RepID=A0ABV2SQC7_9FLAO
MSFLDIVLGILLLFGLLKGLKNGLLIEIASLIALIAGLYGAIHFSYIVGNYLSGHLDWDENYMNLTAFIITFIIIILLVSLVGRLLTKVIDFAMLGLLNRIAGGVFGMLKVAVILGAFLIFFHDSVFKFGIVNEETIEKSVLYDPIKEIGAFVFSKVLRQEK